jgi:hypothetical protein
MSVGILAEINSLHGSDDDFGRPPEHHNADAQNYRAGGRQGQFVSAREVIGMFPWLSFPATRLSSWRKLTCFARFRIVEPFTSSFIPPERLPIGAAFILIRPNIVTISGKSKCSKSGE